MKYKKIEMKNKWEVAFAKNLEIKNIKWQYKPKIFDLEKFKYIPTFYLPETDEFIEIKGVWNDKKQKQFDIFRKKYHSIKLTILSSIEVKHLEHL